MKIRLLKNVGVEISEVSLRDLTKNQYLEIADVFFSELMVLFRDQGTEPLPFAKLVS